MAAGCLTWGSIRATWLDALKSVPRGPLGMRRTSPLPTAAAHAPRDTFALREPSSRFLVRPGLACLTSVPLAEKTVSSVLQGSTSPEPVNEFMRYLNVKASNPIFSELLSPSGSEPQDVREMAAFFASMQRQERRKGGPVSRRSSDTHKLIRYQ